MKVVFLDIDGVLNTLRSMTAQKKSRPFDREAVAALNRLLRETGARIVVSSTWRIGPLVQRGEAAAVAQMDEILTLEGMPPGLVVGVTPDGAQPIPGQPEHSVGGRIWYHAVPRRDEIARWRAAHPEVTAWVALDDDGDAGPENLIHCDDCVGLTEADADAAIAILEAQP